MNQVKIYTLILVAAIASPALAGAEVPRGFDQQAGRRRPAGDADGLGPAQILNMLDAWAIVQAQETLQLTDDKYGEFVTRLKRFQQTRRRNLQGRNAILQELRRLSAAETPQADDNAIQERLRALRAHDERAAAEMRKAYEELDQVLTPKQQARFRLFEEVLERRKIDLLKRAQQGAARRQQ